MLKTNYFVHVVWAHLFTAGHIQRWVEKSFLSLCEGDVLVGLLVSKRYKNIWNQFRHWTGVGGGFRRSSMIWQAFWLNILMPLRSNCQVCVQVRKYAGYELLFLYTCFLHFLCKQPIATMNAFEERLLESVCCYPHMYNSSQLTHGVFPLVLNTRKCTFRVDRNITTDMGEKLI